MKRSFLDTVLRGAEALAARDPVGTLPDPDLLRRFAAGRDPVAFAVLVRRHGPLVWGVCRHLLPADADAEDAFQATFLALVRSADSIRKTEALGGWLHGVAYRVALKARRSAARRKKREVTAAIPEPSSPVPDAAWDELQAAVHEEVCQLPDKLRLPFVLCGLQGRPQKEAAEVLGWKVGTVSGRLSEARRRLLDRLAKRGVPTAVGLGAAVLGGVAGQAAVPASIRVKVMSVAGSPATVSPTVLSLARGVTPMYLTRSKLLAAGLVLVGILTTSVGVLSKADAQAPADPAADLKRYYEALRSHQAPKEKWEYRFVPVDRPLTTADMQKILAGADQEGWSYCGSQDLIHQKTDKATPHMVFKRPATGRVAESTPSDRDRAIDALAKLRAKDSANTDRITEYEQAFRKQLEAERALEAKKLKQFADERAAAERAARDEATRAREVEAQARNNLEKALRDSAWQADARENEAARRKAMEARMAEYETLIEKLQAELKAKAAIPPKKANPSNTKSEQGASNPFDPTTEKPVTALIKLQHLDGKAVASTLARMLPDAKVVAEVSPNSITLTGPSKVIAEAQALIQKMIDVPGGPAAGDAKSEFMVIALKHVSAVEMAKALEKMFDGKGPKVIADQASNRLLIQGTPGALADAKKLVSALDAEKGPAK